MSDNQETRFPKQGHFGSSGDDEAILQIAECMVELETRSKEQAGQIKDLADRLMDVEERLTQMGAILRGSGNRNSG